MKDDEIKARLGVTDMQLQMAYYSGALPTTIDQEIFIEFWERKLTRRRSENKPKLTIYDEPSP